ncbi:MAG: N-acetyl-gamma-glutamyl-phosphate reductase [Ignavibacteria bacterium]|jgi:N-acetyl-gamma-glutamyl-phosphate reductase
MISVGIIGGSGYTGKKLLQYCTNHPIIEEIKIYGNSTAGQPVLSIFPELHSLVDELTVISVTELNDHHDVYFVSLPHGESLKYIPALIEKGKYVIDLGGDFRLDHKELYKEWYKFEHSSDYLLNKKIYGLADYSKLDYSDQNLIANPGCYPTSVLLGLLPLVEDYSDKILSVSSVSYSGTSGAGKSPKQELMVSEMHGNVRAYNVNKHRHEPEILQELNKAGFNSPFSFTTHLLPVDTGIYSTSSVHLKDGVSEDEVLRKYEDTYKDRFFVRLRNEPPNLKWVIGTNFCDINISVKNNKIIICTAVDNLIKGASGQAVQNLNKLFGWDEKLGILKFEGDNVEVY